MDSIFAQCSAHGRAGVAVFRVSGEKAIMALEQLIRHDIRKLEARKLYFRKIYHPITKRQIDESMVVYFNKNSSFTGEESVEIHTHGSLAVIKLLNDAFLSLPYLRLAEAGEFARRSFLNGKMDLTAAEGLADLIDAETELQHSQAIKQLGGGLAKIYEGWRTELLQLMGLLEAYIDFPDEEIPEESLTRASNIIQNLIKEIRNHLDDNNRGERLRNGLKLSILGKPNVGKSSLLNYLMKRDVSIVSDISGTTRDVIEAHIDIGGYPIILQDTAGIHESSTDVIEQEGIKRARGVAKESDIKIIMFDASQAGPEYDYFTDIIDDSTIIVLNKIDLSNKESPALVEKKTPFQISIKNEEGMKELLKQIESIAERIASPSESPQITRMRHRVQLERAAEYLSVCDMNNDLVLLTEDIRMTIRSLSNITGKITVDEILGEIFSNFCIGK